MTALILTLECAGGPSEFLGIPCTPTPPRHDHCPGSDIRPGLLGGWHCSCPCHLASSPQPGFPAAPYSATECAERSAERFWDNVRDREGRQPRMIPTNLDGLPLL